MIWIIILGVLFGIVLMIVSSSKQEKKTIEKLKEQGVDFKKLIFLGKYVGGHIDLDKEIERCSGFVNSDNLIIYEQQYAFSAANQKTTIKLDSISNIAVMDKSSFDNKVTIGRALLVGVFALAWKKKKKNELAFLAIDWKQGKFEHSTIFSYEGKNAMQDANTARNKLIKDINSSNEDYDLK